MPPIATEPPQWVLDADASARDVIDVGEILASGGSPLNVLSTRADTLGEGGTMVVHAPFDPVPLRDTLAQHGLESWASEEDDGTWRVRFRRGGAPAAAPAAPSAAGKGRFWLEGDLLNFDVRGLAPPQPMIEVLKFLDHGPAGDQLVVHVPHVPIHLFPELEERGWTWTILKDDDQGASVLIDREG